MGFEEMQEEQDNHLRCGCLVLVVACLIFYEDVSVHESNEAVREGDEPQKTLGRKGMNVSTALELTPIERVNQNLTNETIIERVTRTSYLLLYSTTVQKANNGMRFNKQHGVKFQKAKQILMDSAKAAGIDHVITWSEQNLTAHAEYLHSAHLLDISKMSAGHTMLTFGSQS